MHQPVKQTHMCIYTCVCMCIYFPSNMLCPELCTRSIMVNKIGIVLTLWHILCYLQGEGWGDRPKWWRRSLFKWVCWKASLRSHQVTWDFTVEKESAMNSEKSVPDKESGTSKGIKLDKDWVSEELQWRRRGWVADNKGEGAPGAVGKDRGPLPTRWELCTSSSALK